MTQPKDEAYIPRTDLGFPDRRKKSRIQTIFADEAEVELWEMRDGRELEAASSKR